MAVARQIATRRPAPGIVIGTGGFLGVVVPATALHAPRRQEQVDHNRVAGGSVQAPGCLDTESEAGQPAAVAPARAGALVEGVLCGTGAAAAGIAAGDVITAAAGRPVSSPDALTAIVTACRPGTMVRVTWVTGDGATRTALVLVDVAPATLATQTMTTCLLPDSQAYRAGPGS
jgi:S1-C subfamily serine protease